VKQIQNQAREAELNAYLTDSAVLMDEKGVRILTMLELKEEAQKMLKSGNHTSIAKVIEATKKLNEPVKNAPIIAKPIRVPNILFFRLIKIAQNQNMTLSDVVQKISIIRMKEKLRSYNDEPNLNQEKYANLRDLIIDLMVKKTSSSKNEYYPDFNYNIDENIKNSFRKKKEYLIYDNCKKLGYPIEIMQQYLNDHWHIDWMALDLRIAIRFDQESGLFSLFFELFLPSYFENYKEYKNNTESELSKKLDEILLFYPEDYDESSDSFISLLNDSLSGTLQIEANKVIFDGINVENKDALAALFYHKLSGEKYSNSVISEYKLLLQEALSNEDYNKADQYNESILRFQVMNAISNWYRDIVLDLVKGSSVITFTLPKPLMLLWEATRGNRSIKEFLETNIQYK